jgi:microcystin degradation protein MlrC
MPRILVAECKQEVSTFNPNLSGYNDFGIRHGQDLLNYHRTVRNEIGGALSIFDASPDVTLVPAYSAFFITSGGTLTDTAWKRIASEFLDAIRSAPPVDAVYLCMHGAMATETELDPEGYLLAETRRILGQNIPIVVSLDLHGIPTRRMFEQSDAIVAYHTYPHVDFFETGQRAARLLLSIIAGRAHPITARIRIPALVRGDELITATGRFGESVRLAIDAESQPGGLSAGMFIGNPFTDVPELATYAFCVTDADPTTASATAKAMAQTFWEHHSHMQVPLLSLEETATRVLAHHGGTLGLVDAADATSSGASGDSNAILKTLQQAGYTGRTLIPIVDAPAAKAAVEAGIGATLTTCVGGTLDPARFTPVAVTGRIRLLSDGLFRSESFGELWDSGPTAVLECENFTLIVSSRGVNLYDRSFFLAHGQDPRRFDAVVIKSPHCQPHMYADWCAQMLNIDAPGSSSANLPYLGHQRAQRPLFPLDETVSFHPETEYFTRNHLRS